MASEIRVNQIQNRTGVSTISFTESGLIFAGISTFQGPVTVNGNLTYEDVTSIDSVGIITAQAGVNVTGGTVIVGADPNDGANPGCKMTTTGVVQATRASGASATFMGFLENDTSANFRVNGDGSGYLMGDVGIGTDDPERTLSVAGNNPMIQIEGTGGNGKQWSIISSDDTTGAAAASRGGNFVIYDDTSGGLGDVLTLTGIGGSMGLGIQNPGAKLHVAAGNIKVDSGFGIDFSATADTSASGATKSSELFADYEEGTFTFTLTDAGSGNELTYYVAGSNSETTARYIRIGQMCYLEIHAPFFQNQGSVGTVNVSGSAPFASLHPAILRGGGPFRGFVDATKDKGPIVVIAGDTRGDGGTSFYLHTADEFANSSGYDEAGGWVRDSPGRNAPGLFVSGSYIIADGA